MKNRKIKFLVLTIALVMGVVGCSTDDTQYRNMQTRLNDTDDNGWFNNSGVKNMPNNTGRLNTRLNNGMTRKNDLNNNDLLNNERLDNNMLGTTNDRFNNGTLSNSINDNTATNNNNISKLSTRANKIAKRVANLKEVSRASVVISGNTAVVGIENKSKTTASKISSDLKKKIEAAVKSVDKDIKKVSITSDPNIHSRLTTMSRDMESGNVVTDFTDEIKDIMRRITAPIR